MVTLVLGIFIGFIFGLAASGHIFGLEPRKQNRVTENDDDERALTRQEHIDRLKQMAMSSAQPVKKTSKR